MSLENHFVAKSIYHHSDIVNWVEWQDINDLAIGVLPAQEVSTDDEACVDDGPSIVLVLAEEDNDLQLLITELYKLVIL